MRIINTFLDKNSIPKTAFSSFDNKILYFDIETTGLSPKFHNIYMVGCLFFDNNELCVRQFFCDTIDEEPAMLEEFARFASDYETFISFNGKSFDQPFLEEKFNAYKITSPFLQKNCVDLYIIAKKIRHLLNVPDLKQKTIERALGCNRLDPFDGGELIIKYHLYEKNQAEELFQELYLHNFEDMQGMIYLSTLYSIYYYTIDDCMVEAKWVETTTFEGEPLTQLSLHIPIQTGISVSLSYRRDDYYLIINPTGFHLSVICKEHTLKVPYRDYKNYVYLPKEDMAIPKALSSGISKNEWEKCNSTNCYGRFQADDDFLNQPVRLKKYLHQVLTYLFAK